MAHLFIITILLLSCAPEKRYPTDPSPKTTQGGLGDLLGSFEPEQDEPENPDPDPDPEDQVQDDEPEYNFTADLNQDGEISDEELLQIKVFQDACREIAVCVVQHMPEFIVAQGDRRSTTFKERRGGGTVRYRHAGGGFGYIEFADYTYNESFNLWGSIGWSKGSGSANGTLLARPTNQNIQADHGFIIGVSLYVTVSRRRVSIYGEFADIETGSIYAVVPVLVASFRNATNASFNNFSATMRGAGGGRFKVSGIERSTWTFEGYAPDRDGRVSINGTIANINLNNQQYPISVRGRLNASLSPSLFYGASGKAVGITGIRPSEEGPDDEDEQTTVELEDGIVFSVQHLPSTIPALTQLELNVNITLLNYRARGTVRNGLAGQRRWDVEKIRGASQPERSLYYNMNKTYRSSLLQ